MWKIWTDKVNFLRPQGKVNGKPGLMFAAARRRDKLPGKRQAVFGGGNVPDMLLFRKTAPAGYRKNLFSARFPVKPAVTRKEKLPFVTVAAAQRENTESLILKDTKTA